MKRTLSILLAICLVVCLVPSFAQNPIYDWVQKKKSTVRTTMTAQGLFTEAAPSLMVGRAAQVSSAVEDATLLQIDPLQVNALQSSNTDYLAMALPVQGRNALQLELVKRNPFGPSHEVITSVPTEEKIEQGAHYWGVVKGDKNSMVAISVFNGHVEGIVVTEEGNLVLGELLDNQNGLHVLYNDKNLKGEVPAGCEGAIEVNKIDIGKELIANNIDVDLENAGKLVEIYVEVHETITNSRGGVNAANQYTAAIFNQSSILFARDNINVKLGRVKVWNSTSPYTGTNSSTLLSQFRSNIGSSWSGGDLAHLIAFKGGGGIAYVNVICSSRSFRTAYSGVRSGFSSVPTYSWTIMVITHEIGHNLGSPHTQACRWNGNNTAIDGCVATEGSCPRPSMPSGGGTIMSYCHLVRNVGINFNKGFGPQPRNLIQSRIRSASCLNSARVSEQKAAALEAEQELVAYPNPTNGEVTISYPFLVDEAYTVQVFSHDGRLIQSQKHLVDVDGSLKLNLGELEKGFYLVKLVMSNGHNKTVRLSVK